MRFAGKGYSLLNSRNDYGECTGDESRPNTCRDYDPELKVYAAPSKADFLNYGSTKEHVACSIG